MQNENSIIKSFLYLVLFLYTTTPCNQLSMSDWAPNLIWVLVPAVLTLVVANIYKVKLFDKSVAIIWGILIVWNIMVYLTRGVRPSPYPFLASWVAYIAFNLYYEDFFDRFIKTTVTLSKIGLVVWLACLIAPNAIWSIASSYGVPTMNVSHSFFIVNIADQLPVVGRAVRNCGFCWEPGRYSCFLMFAMLFYVMKYGWNFKEINLWVLIISLISTKSTTGFGIFIVFMLYWSLANKKLNPFYLVPLAAIIMIIYNLPFMKDKILEFWVDEQSFAEKLAILDYNAQHGGSPLYTPQRFEGLALQWMNITHMPLLTGEGRNFLNFYTNRVLGYNVALSEGLLGIFVSYGLLIGLLCYYSLFKSSRIISNIFGSKLKFAFMVIFLMSSVSYSFWELPYMMVLWLMPLYTKNKF